MRFAGLAALSFMVWTDLLSFGIPWPVLTWGVLAVAVALWITATSPHSIGQVIAKVEAEPTGGAPAPAMRA
jgi:hypothetical protein